MIDALHVSLTSDTHTRQLLNLKGGLLPHDAALETHLLRLMILAANWQQIAPFWPVFADSAGRKSFKNQWPAGTLLPWHGRGRRFDPDQVHHIFNYLPRSPFPVW